VKRIVSSRNIEKPFCRTSCHDRFIHIDSCQRKMMFVGKEKSSWVPDGVLLQMRSTLIRRGNFGPLPNLKTGLDPDHPNLWHFKSSFRAMPVKMRINFPTVGATKNDLRTSSTFVLPDVVLRNLGYEANRLIQDISETSPQAIITTHVSS
jgi:hypothetical protein